jgi:hypothetical protein
VLPGDGRPARLFPRAGDQVLPEISGSTVVGSLRRPVATRRWLTGETRRHPRSRDSRKTYLASTTGRDSPQYRPFLIPQPFTAATQRGTVAHYHPETGAIIRRIEELRRENHRGADLLWQLWCEGRPVDMKGWVAARLGKLMAVLNKAYPPSPDIIEAVASSLPQISGGRVRKAGPKDSQTAKAEKINDLADLLLSAAAGDADINHFTGKIFDVLRNIGGLPLSSAFPLFEAELFDLMRLDRQMAIIAEATDAEMEQARRDWQTIACLVAAVKRVDWGMVLPSIAAAVARVTGAKPEPPSWRARKARRTRPLSPPGIVDFLAARWRSFDQRATAVAFLIGARRPSNSDPDRSKRITEILALADWTMTLFQQPVDRLGAPL